MDNMKLEIKMCMGSSCFARGNGSLLSIIEKFGNDNNIEIDIVGSLCENKCEHGPNIYINGKTYNAVTDANVLEILNQHIKK